MSRDDSQLVLDAIAGRRPNLKGIVRANCPFCETVVHKTDRKQCLSLNTESGYWKCYRCETDGRLHEDELPHDVSTLKKREKTEEKPPVNLPEGFIGCYTSDARAISMKPAWKYLLKGRAAPITQDIIEAARIGACVRGKFAGRIVVPIYKGGKLAGYVGRVWRKKAPPGSIPYLYSTDFERATTLYNEDALYVTTSEPVLVVEGVFDTFPFWPHAVAVLGKPSPAQVEMMKKARRPVFIVFDGDAHREATALAMKLRLADVRAAALKLPPGVDPDECVEHVNRKAIEAFQD